MVKKKNTLEDKLAARQETSWQGMTGAQEKKVYSFADDFKHFLTVVKTEREATRFIAREAGSRGFRELSGVKRLKPGDRVLLTSMGKVAALAVIGTDPIESGMKVVASHIDSPRLDLKQKPLYEDKDAEMALFKTHYYGGIKKYQWVNMPLAIHGIIVRGDGRTMDIRIGEEPGDPVLVVGDLLPHLAHKVQADRKLPDVIKGEELRLIAGNRPSRSGKDAEHKLKLNILDILNRKYGIVEEDLISAEIQVVPAGPARDVGLDGSMVGGYGQDDRVCAYTSLRAILDVKKPKKTSLALFFDKEEVGSIGATGAQGGFFEMAVTEILERLVPDYSYTTLKRVMANSRALSADVDAGVHPMFKEVYDLENAARLGYGIGICKYGGARGKSGSNDANAEFLGEVMRLFNTKKIPWQYTELGKVDEGGGGTVARFISEHNLQVIDCGPPLVSMHSPFEIASKADVYSTYRAFLEFHRAP